MNYLVAAASTAALATCLPAVAHHPCPEHSGPREKLLFSNEAKHTQNLPWIIAVLFPIVAISLPLMFILASATITGIWCQSGANSNEM